MKLYAEELDHYWKTGKSTPDSWLDKAGKIIEKNGGHVFTQAFGKDQDGNAAYFMEFQLEKVDYKIVWPVLKSKGGDDYAARRQAATLLFHDIKSRCLSAKILGVRAAFFSYIVLPDGRTASQASLPELTKEIPLFLNQKLISRKTDN